MKRAWMHLALIVALIVMLSATAVGWQKPPADRPVAAADSLRSLLEKKGYVAIPLTQEERDNCFTVECKSGSETFRLLLDTGAADSNLDIGLVKKLGLKQGDEVRSLGIEGIRTGVSVSLRGLSIGGFDTRSATSLHFVASDFTNVNTARDRLKLRRIDGLLGRSILEVNSVVIDFPTRTLYLRAPLKPEPASGPVAVADPLRSVLEKKGYVAIPLIAREEDGNFTVKCKSGTETFRLVLDTGAEASALDMSLVKKLGLKHEGEVAIGVGGTLKGAEVNLRGLSIGDFDTRTVVDSLFLVAFDFTALNAILAQRKLRPIDGVLGHSTLGATSAVIDYSTRTLYLCTLLTGLWPEIEGRWVATGGQQDGNALVLDPATPLRLGFKDRQFHLTDGTTDHRFGLHINPVKDHYTMMFFDPEQELAKELKYKTGGLLKVSEGKLTVCLGLDLATAKGKLPEDFKAPAGSGHLLLEFRREK